MKYRELIAMPLGRRWALGRDDAVLTIRDERYSNIVTLSKRCPRWHGAAFEDAHAGGSSPPLVMPLDGQWQHAMMISPRQFLR